MEKEKSPEEAKSWDRKLNKENVTVFLKKGGSLYDKNQPYIMTEMAFNSFYQMRKVIEAVSFKY